MVSTIVQKLKNTHTPKNTSKISSPETHAELPKLENYDLSKLKGGGSKNPRQGGGWDLN